LATSRWPYLANAHRTTLPVDDLGDELEDENLEDTDDAGK
jgi:hypothetical protein